jgi:acetyltransferase
MFQNFSEESIRYRFFQIIKDTPHETRVRYCNIDYDREIAIVPELTEDGRRKILGVTRVSIEPDGKKGEIAFIVADPWQGLGLGTKMVDYVLEICKDMKVETVYAIILPDNYRAINLMKKMGFTTQYAEDGTVRATLNLREEEEAPCSDAQTARTAQQELQETSRQKQAENLNAAQNNIWENVET